MSQITNEALILACSEIGCRSSRKKSGSTRRHQSNDAYGAGCSRDNRSLRFGYCFYFTFCESIIGKTLKNSKSKIGGRRLRLGAFI